MAHGSRPAEEEAPPRPARAGINEAVHALRRLADAASARLPRPLRGAGRFGFLLTLAVLAVIALPFWPLLARWQRRMLENHHAANEPVLKLELHLRRLWSGSADAAVARLRVVLDRVRSASAPVEIPPYGSFDWKLCGEWLADVAYRYEFQAGHFDRALEIAEAATSEWGLGHPFRGTWIVSRARCLVQLDRLAEAKALLLAARDPEDPSYEVNRYLEELRGHGSDGGDA